MSSFWECHDDAVADAIHAERYGDVGELEYACPYCFGEEVFKHVNGSSDDVQCTGCERTGTVKDGVVTVDPEHVALTPDDYEHALWYIPDQLPFETPLPEPYWHLVQLRKVAS